MKGRYQSNISYFDQTLPKVAAELSPFFFYRLSLTFSEGFSIFLQIAHGKVDWCISLRQSKVGVLKVVHNINMGILRLGEFLKKCFPGVIKHRPLQSYRGRVFAVDASSTIYSFLAKTVTYSKNHLNMPTDSHGNMTGHLIGLLYRALLCKELGMNTVWVFDGKPPRQKSDELYRRRQIKEEAAERADSALEEGDVNEAVRQTKRTIFVTETERKDAKRLIQLMGMPVIQASSEAEAQCAWMAKNKLVEGVIGEDIDTLVFGGNTLVKHFNRGDIAAEINLLDLLSSLELSQEQFIDFCILCGCDYTAKVPGIGPVKALKMIKQEGSIQGVLNFIGEDSKLRNRHPVPDDFNYLIARRLFLNPEVIEVNLQDIEQKDLQETEIRNFLLEKDFNEKRIENWIAVATKFDHQHSDPSF